MDAFTELVEETQTPEKELTSILRQGALLRLPYLESRFQSAKAESERIERKYNTTLQQLRREGLADDAGYEVHEDFIEWEYWADELGRLQQIIAQVQRILTATTGESIPSRLGWISVSQTRRPARRTDAVDREDPRRCGELH